jgi:hypothetical protein
VRVFVRLLSVVLALAVAGAGVLTALEVGWHWWRPASGPLLIPWPAWQSALSETGWDSFAVRLTAGVTVAAGLVLMLLALSASRRAVRMHDPATEVSFTTSPRSLARLVGIAVRAQDNVHSAAVTASAKRVRVRATSRLETEAELRPRLMETVSALLDDVPLARKPKVSVVVDSPRDRT